MTKNYLSITVSKRKSPGFHESVSGYGLEKIEASGVDCRTCFTFKHSPQVKSYVCDTLCSEMMKFVANFEETGAVLSIPDHLFENSQLTLSKLKIFGTECVDGRTSITIRWSLLVGNVFSVLKFGPDVLLSQGEPNTKLAFNVLDSILAPIFDIVEIGAAGLPVPVSDDEILKRLDALKSKSAELHGYASLLRTYLRHIGEPCKGTSGRVNTKQKYLN